MQGKYAYKRRAMACAVAALLAVVGFSTSALADSFTSTLANPTTDTTNPSPCALPAVCTLTLGGSQSSSLGGSGTYTIVDKISSVPYRNGAKWCINLATGSTLTLKFSTGSIAMTTDGPFSETKDVLGGFYLFEAADLDSALGVAARIPAARMGGSVEVRPIVER